MPIFFQQQINETTRLGIWKIEETEEFFKGNVPLHRNVTHPHKRLQHLAGRFLLQFLVPDFPYSLIQIADTKKPFLTGEQYHFSISHCGDYAAAIVSKDQQVGIDVELPTEKIARIADKFANPGEQLLFSQVLRGENDHLRSLTLIWSAKEAVFKWYGKGSVDFRQHILLQQLNADDKAINCSFTRTGQQLVINYHIFEQVVLTFLVN